jgi:hypothetical protein
VLPAAEVSAASQLLVLVLLLLLQLLLALALMPCARTTVAHLEGAADNLHLVVLPDRHCTNL